jgi:hypothetical protein
MNRYSPTIPGDPADKARAAELNERAIVMVDAGYLEADYQNGCVTLADVRRKVEAAEGKAAKLAQAADTEMPDSFDATPPADADEADRQAISHLGRYGY